MAANDRNTSLLPALPPTLLVVGSMISIQWAAVIAKPLMADLGSSGVVLLRLSFAALMLMLIQQPRLRGHSRSDYRNLLWFGLSIAWMNCFYYAAIERLPLGIAVAIGFLGPLGVAIYKSRRRLDWLWVVLASVGILLLAPTPHSNLDSVGILFALLGAVGWGSYILASAKVCQSLPTRQAIPIAMTISAVLFFPLGISHLGPVISQPRFLWLGALVGFLGSVVTHSLEFAALKRMPVNVFGVLLSVEPAIAALISFVLLGETLSGLALVAIALVSIAAGGASYSEQNLG